jgi:hypothetical protein
MQFQSVKSDFVQVDFSVPKTKTKKRKIIKVQVQVIACDLFFIFHLKKKVPLNFSSQLIGVFEVLRHIVSQFVGVTVQSMSFN